MQSAKPLIFILTATFLTTFAVSDEERLIEESFEMGEAPRFSLENYKGQIKIRTHNESTITVKARAYLATPDGRLTEDEKQRMLDGLEIDFRHSDRRLHVETDYEPKSFKRGLFGIGIFTPEYPMVEFDIVLPEDASILLDSYKSEFDVQAGNNYVQIESYKGTGTISGIKNDFDINTYKGEFEIDIEDVRDLDINTYKGRLDISFQQAEDFELNATSNKGDIDISGIAAENMSTKKRTRFKYMSGNGHADIDVNTYKGDIKLRFE